MNRLTIAVLVLFLPVLSCGAQEEAPQPETSQLESATRELRCGCKIDGIGTCGNYVADGEDWLEISNPNDHDLHVMEWCKVKPEIHVMGTVAGERTGETVKVSTLLVDY